MDYGLTDKVVLINGSTGGIGQVLLPFGRSGQSGALSCIGCFVSHHGIRNPAGTAAWTHFADVTEAYQMLAKTYRLQL